MFFGLLALLIPGIMIAYVLPLIPWVMWIAGVTGYLILVLEAVIAVPLMMVAHMTFDARACTAAPFRSMNCCSMCSSGRS
ncbi:hypothetical protein [Methylosinus sp. PW1]|uniref:hypothetical protein n=1 Tax=Methylosinus sp. PW1 TaxID=107636 RepID=UPI00068A00EA|nr:hypothetical protein [Methylosinus sp. PW1]